MLLNICWIPLQWCLVGVAKSIGNTYVPFRININARCCNKSVVTKDFVVVTTLQAIATGNIKSSSYETVESALKLDASDSKLEEFV